MKQIVRFILLVAFSLFTSAALAEERPTLPDNIILRVNEVVLDSIRAAGTPIAARDLNMVHTACYDAWAAYTPDATPLTPGAPPRQPRQQWQDANKTAAIAFAAHTVLKSRWPARVSAFDEMLRREGLDPNASSRAPTTPAGVGRMAGDAVLKARRNDGANEFGSEQGAQTPFSDYTGYKALNTSTKVVDPAHWQPLSVMKNGVAEDQVFVSHIGRITMFASTAAELLPPPPPAIGSAEYKKDVEELVRLAGQLNDDAKAKIEFWADGPRNEKPAGYWNMFAQFVSRRDKHTLDDDAKMFFFLNQAMFDAGIACWNAKRHFDYVRPITAIRLEYKGRKLRAWAGPNQGIKQIAGEDFRPYIQTPPFPEYTSGHSSYTAAAARALALFTGSDTFGHSVTIAKGSSKEEPGVTPAKDVKLSWPTFTAAADEAAYSRRQAGLHFLHGDMEGRVLGRKAADRAWAKAQTLFHAQLPRAAAPAAGTTPAAPTTPAAAKTH